MTHGGIITQKFREEGFLPDFFMRLSIRSALLRGGRGNFDAGLDIPYSTGYHSWILIIQIFSPDFLAKGEFSLITT